MEGCRLEGRVVLGCGPGARILDSTLVDSEVGEEVQLDRVSLLRRTVVDRGACLRACLADCGAPTSFGLEGEIQAGLETGGREVPFFVEGTLRTYADYLEHPETRGTAEPRPESSFSYIGERARITGGYYDRVWLGAFTRATGVLSVENSCVLSGKEEPSILGPGVILRDSLVQWGGHVDSGAQVYTSVLLEHSGAERQALVTQSLLGPNTHVGEGEVTASLLGPFVGMHHQSLLIAAWWPEGGGNVGYGANVGSNHTGRLPDQEVRPGEGMFFGLGVNVKFPCDFTQAPYTLAATGVTLPPQRCELPFSLIVAGESPLENRIIPGWSLAENLYALFRNRKKYLSRDKARRQACRPDPFREEIVDKVWKAWEELGKLCGKESYTFRDWGGIGGNLLSERDRISGVSAYAGFLKFLGIRGKLSSLLRQTPAEPWLERIFLEFLPGSWDEKSLLKAFLSEFDKIIASVEKSRHRDWERGERIIPDYRNSHGNPEDDPVIAGLKKDRDLWALGSVPE